VVSLGSGDLILTHLLHSTTTWQPRTDAEHDQRTPAGNCWTQSPEEWAPTEDRIVALATPWL